MAHKCDGCRYKSEHQEMMFRPMGVCLRESNLVKAVQNYDAEKCPYKKTNADRVRAMSDADLAEFIVDQECIECRQYKTDECREKCVEHWLEWLKQPAPEGE